MSTEQGLCEFAEAVDLAANHGTEGETSEPCCDETAASEGNGQPVAGYGECKRPDLKPGVGDPLPVIGVDHGFRTEPTEDDSDGRRDQNFLT